ncbi:peptide ABC transporter substrate-binding protein [Streptomyces hydrogenans]|uniref:peptide ABC transporter substrate-binding protein n=1 Tax=Streptomyces hydrogenans TaxID=1873719 RepID=UPI0033330BD3
MRATRRAGWAVAAVTAVALAAGACGGEEADGILRASWGDPQNQLEPANTIEVRGGTVLDLIFTGLKEYDPGTGEAVNAMAESIETDDQQTFTVRIKRGWTFSDGTEVTADSFVDAWNYGAHLKNNQVASSVFRFIKGYEDVHPDEQGAKPTADRMSGLEVVNDHTFRVVLGQKFSLWPQTLGYPAYAPLPRAFFDDHETWLDKPVGNGPYQVDAYDRGRSMRLSRYEDYSGADKARNAGVEFVVYTDNNTAYTDLRAGNLDVVDDIPATQVRNVENDLDGRFINQPAGIVETISFPLYQEEWRSPGAATVRRGISMAIDREEIIDKIYGDTRTPATDWTSPVLGEKGGYEKELCGETCTHDPKRARQLIEEGGGLPGGSITLTGNVDSGSNRLWMDAVCNSINNAMDDNKACRVVPVGTFAQFRQQVGARRMTGMFLTGWQMDYPLIQNFLQPIYYTGSAANDSGYSDPEFDRLVDEGNAAPGQQQAIEKFKDAESLLVEDFPVIPVWYRNGTVAYSNDVDNVRLNPFSVPVFTEITVG